MNKLMETIFAKTVSGQIDVQTGSELIQLIDQQEHVIQEDRDDIAIIGMSFKLPGAITKHELWDIIRNGKVVFDQYTEERQWDARRLLRVLEGNNNATFEKGGFLNEVDKFDYNFFRLSPSEANLMDPSQRLFLEVAWETIEDAGYGGGQLTGTRTGVFVGYNGWPIYLNFVSKEMPSSYATAVAGNVPSIIPSRLSYFMDLRGPSLLIDTACSSSLVALHLACQSIRKGECDAAIAGGVKIIFAANESSGKLGTESTDGYTRTFDDRANGSGIGEGIVAVLVKPLKKAIQDRDQIYAVIKGSAINQDGKSIGITAPNPIAQEDVLLKAWEDAGIDPMTIDYIEAHGTGTKLGDPIEIEGITRAFRRFTDKSQFCAIGSLKSNIGHIDCAAGIAGVIKAALALKNKEIPPLAHFQQPNRVIPFHKSPVFINDQVHAWEQKGHPRRCGVSAFGLSGTNCHIVLEEAPPIEDESVTSGSTIQVFTVSAMNELSLKAMIDKYIRYLETEESTSIQEICHSANVGRNHYNYRLAFLAQHREELHDKLLKTAASLERDGKVDAPGCFFGFHQLISANHQMKEENDISVEDKEHLNSEAASLLQSVVQGMTAADHLAKLCELYIKGSDVNWSGLYEGSRVRCVSLPTYAFDPIRCWLPGDDQVLGEQIEDLMFAFDWKASDKVNFVMPGRTAPGTVLLFADRSRFCDELYERIAASGDEIVRVHFSEDVHASADNRQCIEIKGEYEDYVRLLDSFDVHRLSKIVHAATISIDPVGSFEQLQKTQQAGHRSLFLLAKAMISYQIVVPVDVVLIGRNVNKVTGEEAVLCPEIAPLFGLGRVITEEQPNFRARALDIDMDSRVSELWDELEQPGLNYLTAFRKGRRYVQELKRIGNKRIKPSKSPLKQGGVYLITGGLGGLGLEIGHHISLREKVTLILLSRSSFPAKYEWENIVRKGENKKLRSKIVRIQEIEKNGCEVVIVQANVGNKEDMEKVDHQIQSQFGKFDGIVHCAGAAGEGLIVNKDEETFRKVTEPKIEGTWNLYSLCQKSNIDFLILFSSMATILPSPGLSDYVSGNVYLDAFSEYIRNQGVKAVTINWSGWRDVGMHSDLQIKDDGVFSILPRERAVAAFDWIINNDYTNIVVGQINYSHHSLQDVLHIPFDLSPQLISELDRNKQRREVASAIVQADGTPIELKGKLDGSYTVLEEAVGRIWGEELGRRQINIYNNFYEMGGNSLIASRIVTKITRDLGYELSLRDFLSHLYIQDMASYLEAKELEQGDASVGKKEDINIASPTSGTGELLFPASSGQRRMYFVHQLDQSKVTFNITGAVRIDGRVEPDRLQQALDLLVKRHGAFRTSFLISNGILQQQVGTESIFQVQQANADSMAEVRDLIQQLDRPFDLSKAPLLRVVLIKLPRQQFVLGYCMHHIISDGRSCDIFMNELLRLYGGERLPDPKLQYVHFAAWQEKFVHTEKYAAQEKFWQHQLEGYATSVIPMDFPRSHSLSFAGDKVIFQIDKSKLIPTAIRSGATVAAILLAVLHVLLLKYTSLEDIVTGCMVDGRSNADYDGIIGLFINNVVIRSYPQKNKKFIDYLQEVKETLFEAFTHQDYAFEELIRKLNVSRDMARNPVFDVCFNMLTLPNVVKSPDSFMKIEPIDFGTRNAKFDIAFNVFDLPDEIKFEMDYKTSLFRRTTAETIANHYQEIVSAVIENIEVEIDHIALSNNKQQNKKNSTVFDEQFLL